MISLPRGTGLRSAVEAAYAAAGLPLHVAFEASDPRMLARLAAHGLGLAFLPASVVAAHGDDLRMLSMRDPEIRGRLALAWRAEDPVSPAARALIAHARAALPAPASPPSSGTLVSDSCPSTARSDESRAGSPH